MVNKLSDNTKEVLISFLLRSGLALVFFYAAVSSFLQPEAWIGYIPSWIQSVISPYLFLKFHALGELILGLWLLSNKGTFYASILSAVALLAIIISNITSLDIIFRDIAIFFGALALVVLSYKNN